MTLDPQIAGLIDALDGGFPAVHTMTGAQARAAIRSRFAPAPRPAPVAAGEALRVAVAGAAIRVRW